jgi:hypothetical protein
VSNLGSIPQIPTGTAITLVSNADWLDQFYIQQAGFPSQPMAVGGTLNGTTTVVITLPTLTTPTTTITGPLIVPGMLCVGWSIPPNTSVVAVSPVVGNSYTLTLSNFALATATNVPLFLYGPPLDLTGVTFKSMVRITPQSTTVLLIASTANGLMVNGGQGGTFGWNVPAARLPAWPIGLATVGLLNAAVDIQASDPTGSIVNLCAQSGPLPLSITLPETR